VQGPEALAQPINLRREIHLGSTSFARQKIHLAGHWERWIVTHLKLRELILLKVKCGDKTLLCGDETYQIGAG
jgi:hypothetical protein